VGPLICFAVGSNGTTLHSERVHLTCIW